MFIFWTNTRKDFIVTFVIDLILNLISQKFKSYSIITNSKPSAEAILQNICSFGMIYESYVFLQNFEKVLPGNLVRSYGIFFSWKIVCVFAQFLRKLSWKFDVFVL